MSNAVIFIRMLHFKMYALNFVHRSNVTAMHSMPSLFLSYYDENCSPATLVETLMQTEIPKYVKCQQDE